MNKDEVKKAMIHKLNPMNLVGNINIPDNS